MSRDTADRYWWGAVFKRFPMDGVAKGIARAIADESDRNTGQICRVTMDDLVLSSGQSERTIQRKLPIIVRAGFMRYTPSTVKGTSSVYQLMIPEGLPLERPKDGAGREQISAWLESKGVSVTPKAKGVSASPKSDLGRQGVALTPTSGVTQSDSGVTVTPPPLLHEEHSTSSAADAATTTEAVSEEDGQLSLDEAWVALRENLDDMLAAPEYSHRRTLAYREVLGEIQEHADLFSELSPKAVNTLTQRVVGHAVDLYWGERMDADDLAGVPAEERLKRPAYSRLYQLSNQVGPEYVVAAIARGLMASPTQDVTSYITSIATNLRKDAA